MTIEAMKQALEALETTQTLMRLSDPQYVREYNAITSLRQAIAEAEKQEPVSECVDDGEGGVYYKTLALNPPIGLLYTHPYVPTERQPKREPLTDEQVNDLHGEANRGFCIEREDYFKAFRDAETAHGITSDMKQEHVDKTAKQRHEENT